MSQDAHIAERRQQMLAKRAELDLAAIDTPEEAEKGRTYQRMGRSLRQSLALHERFEHLSPSLSKLVIPGLVPGTHVSAAASLCGGPRCAARSYSRAAEGWIPATGAG